MKKLFSVLMLVVLMGALVGVSNAQAPAIQPVSPARPVGPVTAAPNPQAVLWDQPLSTVNQNAIADQDFTDVPTFSAYVGDDFVNSGLWNINLIYIPGDGWNGFTTLMNASALNWGIWPDAGGVPAGDPSSGGAVWSLTLPPTDPQVVISNSTPGGVPAVTTLTLSSPISLPAGHWWLLFWPTMPFSGGGQFGRQPSDTLNGYQAQWINPGGGFGIGTAWQPWSNLSPVPQDSAFRLEGTPGGIHAHINKSKINKAPAAKPGYYKIVFSTRIWDSTGAPAVGTTVYGTWTYPDLSTHPMTYVTTAAGQAKFPIKTNMLGTYTFQVTNIAGNGYAYDPGANTGPDTLSITIP